MLDINVTQEEIHKQYTKDQLITKMAEAGEMTHMKIWKHKDGNITITPTYFKAAELSRCIRNGMLFVDIDEFKCLIKKKAHY